MNVSYISYIIESAKIIQNYSLFFCITLVMPVRCRRRRNEICVVNIRLGERGGGGCPENWFRSESGFGLGLALELGLGEFSSGAIFLEPIGVNGFHFLYFFLYRHHLIFKHDASKFMFCHHLFILWKLFGFKRQSSTKKLFFACPF